jgi:hypothetical protein
MKLISILWLDAQKLYKSSILVSLFWTVFSLLFATIASLLENSRSKKMHFESLSILLRYKRLLKLHSIFSITNNFSYRMKHFFDTTHWF